MRATGLTSQTMLADASGVSQTGIGNILREERNPDIHRLALLAGALGLEAWQLLLPSEMAEALLTPEAARLFRAYCESEPKGRGLILAVAETQAEIAKHVPGD